MTAGPLDRLARLDSCAVSDALDMLGITGVALGLTAVADRRRIVGRAVTVDLELDTGSAPARPGRRHLGTVAVDAAGPGDIIVVAHHGRTQVAGWGGLLSLDNAGRMDGTVWGDLLTATAARRRIGGTVIDGVCRDSDRAVELGYPVYSRGRWMRTGKDRVRVDGYQVPVAVGGARVAARANAGYHTLQTRTGQTRTGQTRTSRPE